MKRLIAELNDLLATPEATNIAADEQRQWILGKLSKENAAIYESLPEGVAKQLTMERDPHGNVQVSLIETENYFPKWLRKNYKSGKLKVNSMANLQLNIISLVTKDAAQLPQTMMQIIVMH